MQPFIPISLPPDNLDWGKLVPFISKAMNAVGEYNGLLNSMVNPNVLLSPITHREAILSSRIEGTIASYEEILRHEAGQVYNDKKEDDIREIINYRKALITAEKHLTSKPISLHLVRELHAILMDNVRGSDKTPGSFRTTQNHIGAVGSRIEHARFIPPDPLIMNASLDAWHTFIQADFLEPLVQLAIMHAQFEIIHPFGDGNGRIGRMLIPLFLYYKSVLQKPVFYLSEYLEKHDEEYRDRLLATTQHGDWQGWVEFFLKGIHIQANSNSHKARKILELYQSLKEQFVYATKSQFSLAALDAFFTRPICSGTAFQTMSKIKPENARNILKNLQKKDLITVLKEGAGRRSTIYALPELLHIAEGKQIILNKRKKA